jgi:hypothetical protein
MINSFPRVLAHAFDEISTALVHGEKSKALSLANMGAVLARRSEESNVVADDLQTVVDAHHANFPAQAGEVDFTNLKQLLQ